MSLSFQNLNTSDDSLTNIIKADSPAPPSKQLKWTVLILDLMRDVGNLFKTEGAEDRVRISFIIGMTS